MADSLLVCGQTPYRWVGEPLSVGGSIVQIWQYSYLAPIHGLWHLSLSSPLYTRWRGVGHDTNRCIKLSREPYKPLMSRLCYNPIPIQATIAIHWRTRCSLSNLYNIARACVYISVVTHHIHCLHITDSIPTMNVRLQHRSHILHTENIRSMTTIIDWR